MKVESGFSLIELMVVVAIVGVLSAIAVPAYNSYITRAKIGSILPVLDDLASQTKAYYATNGSIPTLAQLGYNTTGTTFPDDVDPSSLADYVIPPYVMSIEETGENATSGQCAHFAVSAAYSNIDSSGVYTSSNPNATAGVLTLGFVENGDGVWQSLCDMYQFSNSNGNTVYATGTIFPGCYNSYDQVTELYTVYDAMLASCS